MAITTVTEVPPAPSSTTTSSNDPTTVTLSTVAPAALTGPVGSVTSTDLAVPAFVPSGHCSPFLADGTGPGAVEPG